MKTLTCICQEHGNPSPLIYTIEAKDDAPTQKQVANAIRLERELDLGDDAADIEVMFCFEGDLTPCFDWRD